MYLFVPCDKKSHGTEISFPIRSNRLSHPHPRRLDLILMKNIFQCAGCNFRT